MTDKERLLLIIDETAKNPSDFAKSIKPDQRVQWIYDVIREKISTAGNPVGISKDLAFRIVEKYPQYNVAWVCLGVGDKYVSETKTSPAVAEDVKKSSGGDDEFKSLVEANLRSINKVQKLTGERLGSLDKAMARVLLELSKIQDRIGVDR